MTRAARASDFAAARPRADVIRAHAGSPWASTTTTTPCASTPEKTTRKRRSDRCVRTPARDARAREGDAKASRSPNDARDRRRIRRECGVFRDARAESSARGRSRGRGVASVVERGGETRAEEAREDEDRGKRSETDRISLVFGARRKTRGSSSVPSSRRRVWCANNSTLSMSSSSTRCKRLSVRAIERDARRDARVKRGV